MASVTARPVANAHAPDVKPDGKPAGDAISFALYRYLAAKFESTSNLYDRREEDDCAPYALKIHMAIGYLTHFAFSFFPIK